LQILAAVMYTPFSFTGIVAPAPADAQCGVFRFLKLNSADRRQRCDGACNVERGHDLYDYGGSGKGKGKGIWKNKDQQMPEQLCSG
jgi:hypothetical protein